MNNEIIENLFALNYWMGELKELNEFDRGFEINQFNYDFFVEGINFRIIKDLLIVENEYCACIVNGGDGVYNYTLKNNNRGIK